MTKRTRMMIVAFATLILAGLLVGCSDSMTNPTSSVTRNDNQVFDVDIALWLLVTPENGSEEDMVKYPVNTNGAVLEVTEGELVQLLFDFTISNDRGVPQLAAYYGQFKVHDFSGKKGERFLFPVNINTAVVGDNVSFEEVELWIRKDHPNFAQLLWGNNGKGQNDNAKIIVNVLPKPVVEPEYKWVDGVSLVDGNIVIKGLNMAANAVSQGNVTLTVNGAKLSTSNSNEFNNDSSSLTIKTMKYFTVEVNTVVIKISKHTQGNTTYPAAEHTYTIYKVNGVVVGNEKV